jgi:Ca-activated chloride channel family protein
MRRTLLIVTGLLAWVGAAQAHGLLIPDEKTVPPLAMVNHRVHIAIEDQVALTKVEQTFRNHTDRQLEATYVFPVPKGASVNKFTMSVNGKEVAGELVEADRARQIYTEIVRRTQDPGLLEYMGNNLLRMRVFPIPPKADQKVTVSYTAIAARDAGLVEYIYPLKIDGKATRTLEEFAIQATIKSQYPIQNIYSPTHAISVQRPNDREAAVTFDRNQGLLDKDFQLFYATGDQEIGFTLLTHRPISGERGYFLLLLTPRVELSQEHYLARDMMFVLDTSGSMRGTKMDQAKRALKYCLENLNPKDHFGLINFATTVNRYSTGLVDSTQDQVEQAKKWVDRLEATGGTAINDALAAALALRSNDPSRTFTLVFFTDGMPTVGETNADKILKNVSAKNTANTRIFTFGVGDDVNATFLDQLADSSRAVSTYVRPAEDIEAKVSSLYSKISHPVLANLKLATGSDVPLDEVYPPQLPDLFHGGQLVVLGRYTGQGPAAVTLSGTVGKDARDFVYEVRFPDRTNEERSFVEHLWGRRKVGYLLDQIRANGEKKELVDEVVALAKKYGIATPYTSYLIVPDGPMPVAANAGPGRLGGGAGRGGMMPGGAMPGGGFGGGFGGVPGLVPWGLTPPSPKGEPQKVADFAKGVQNKPGDLAQNRGRVEDAKFRSLPAGPAGGEAKPADGAVTVLQEAGAKKDAYDKAREYLARRQQAEVQGGKLGVDLSVQTNNLRNQSRLELTALRRVAHRNCLEIGGVWIDEGFDAKMPLVTVKAQSDAYFRILQRQPQVKEVFQLGNYLVWVTPSNTALVIDQNDGKEKLTDVEIDQLFVVQK